MLHDELFDSHKLSLVQVTVLEFLIRAHAFNATRPSTPLSLKNADIAERFNLSPRIVQYATKRLCELKLIEKTSAKGGQSQANHYVIKYKPPKR